MTSSSSTETADDGREVRIATLSAMAFVVGIVAAIGAVIFRILISIVYNAFYLGKFGLSYDANVYDPPSPLGAFIILAPVIGGLVVVWLVKTFAPEAKGHGVPEVMYAIYHNSGNVRGVVAVVKSLASAISIGSGASVGREGPIIQIGSSFGSTFGRMLGLVRWQRITLLAAGAGAGIAATFNTPLGGVLFAVELLLPEVSGRTFMPVVVATATATYVGRVIFGLDPAFLVPVATFAAHEAVSVVQMIAFIFLGILAGVASWGFVRLLAYSEDFFPKIFPNDYIQNIVGMTMVGLLAYGFFKYTGHYETAGVGYSTIQSILVGGKTGLVVLVLLFFGKMLATSISLGSGASGGVFSPSLFLGSSLGAIVGVAGMLMFPDAGFKVEEFAVVGMGAMVGGATSAAMTAIVMIFEMTRDYNVIVPLVVAVTFSVGVRRWLIEEDIYTIKLRHRGKRIPINRHTNMYLMQSAGELMTKVFKTLPEDASVKDAAKALMEGEHKASHIVLSEGDRIVGYLRPNRMIHELDDENEPIRQFMRSDFVIAREKDTMNDVISRMNRRNVKLALVVNNDNGIPRIDDVSGVIDVREIASAVVENHYS